MGYSRTQTPVKRMSLADLRRELALSGTLIRATLAAKQARMREILDEIESRQAKDVFGGNGKKTV